MKFASLAAGAAAVLFGASVAIAAPCNTDAAKGKVPEGSTASNSSAVDKGSKNEAGGSQPASPGTVGAMNNVGANQGMGQQASTGSSEAPGAKNMAGGNQPSSPGTVGAMNATGAKQGLGKDDGC